MRGGAWGGRVATGLLVLVAVAVGCSRPVPKENLAGGPQVQLPPPPAPKETIGPGRVDADAPEEFSTTPSGLKYRIRRKGNGRKPTASDSVVVHYRGWLDDGRVFDTSYASGKTISFPLKAVVPGWTEGLQFVDEGGMIELEIPSELGYGSRGFPPNIPGDARLHFLVELFAVQ